MNKWLKGFVLSALVAISANAQSNHDFLISGEEAIKLIGKKNVVFVSGDNHDVFEAQGHIKGAVEMGAHHLHHADITGHLHCAPLYMCPDEAKEYIESKGISNDTLVIAYDDFKGPNATGVYAYFKSWGHKNLKMLDGGVAAIKEADANQAIYDTKYQKSRELRKLYKDAKKAKDDANYKKYKAEYKAIKKELKAITKTLMIVKGKEKKRAKGHYELDPKKIDYSMIASKEDVFHAMKDIKAKGEESNYVIIDTRRFAEIMGEGKLDNVARGGHVPGAKFIEWTQIYNKDAKRPFSSLEKMQAVMDKYGITKDKTIYAYCHVGAGRSSHVIMSLKMLGYEHAKVYVGSWDQWGNDMDLPITR